MSRNQNEPVTPRTRPRRAAAPKQFDDIQSPPRKRPRPLGERNESADFEMQASSDDAVSDAETTSPVPTPKTKGRRLKSTRAPHSKPVPTDNTVSDIEMGSPTPAPKKSAGPSKPLPNNTVADVEMGASTSAPKTKGKAPAKQSSGKTRRPRAAPAPKADTGPEIIPLAAWKTYWKEAIDKAAYEYRNS
ncbi:hypothetical protein FS749_015734 [Ceratobasidium sp. UAMH 11750]|nr:hypothetical protein FS749_015734 [Ceratobasidium sp. UAMH 11750]